MQDKRAVCKALEHAKGHIETGIHYMKKGVIDVAETHFDFALNEIRATIKRESETRRKEDEER